jgi:hypothetical protein
LCLWNTSYEDIFNGVYSEDRLSRGFLILLSFEGVDCPLSCGTALGDALITSWHD